MTLLWIFALSLSFILLENRRFLILVLGPTAVGKTDICLNLANFFNTEVISCDSRQFYKEMNLGTAKPSQKELDSVPHHFINSLSIMEDYDVRKFEKDGLELLDRLFKNHEAVIMTGGSGLFADAIVDGMDEMPEIDQVIREDIIQEFKERGLPFLQAEVARLDPTYFDQVDRQNPQRLMRALEVCRGTGRPFSSFRIKAKQERNFKTIKIGLELDRAELYERIDRRMDQMVAAGLFDEAKALFGKRHLNALQTVGYSEIFGFLEGNYEKEEAIRLLKRNSRRYAKRQLTWFKRDESITWFRPSEEKEIIKFLKDQIG